MTGTAAIDQAGMRRVNTAATLRALARADGPTTVADLVAQTRLSRRTIELILVELGEAGWVVEVPAPAPVVTAGRPRKYVELVADRAVVLALVIDPPRVQIVLADVRGRELARAIVDTGAPEDAERVLARATDAARRVLADSEVPADRLREVVVGVGGTVSPDGVVLTSPVGAAWVGQDLAGRFSAAFAASVLVENDTNLIAVAELATGAARDAPTFVLLTPGDRVSAAVMIDGSLHRGFQGAAGELVRLPDLGRASAANPIALVTSPRESQRADARELIRRAVAGDAEATAFAHEFFASTARLIAVIGWVLAPPVVVLSGGFEGVEQHVHDLVRSALGRVDIPEVDVRISPLAPDAALRGAVRLGLANADSAIFDDPALNIARM